MISSSHKAILSLLHTLTTQTAAAFAFIVLPVRANDNNSLLCGLFYSETSRCLRRVQYAPGTKISQKNFEFEQPAVSEAIKQMRAKNTDV